VNRVSLFRAALIAALLVAAFVFWMLFSDRLDAPAIEATAREYGVLGPLMFVASFAFATVLFVPGSLFGLAGGLLFGPLWGTVWNVTGATLGATVAFLIARFVAGDWIARRAKGRFQTLISGVDAEGWRFVALTRLVPIVPFNLLNYGLGLTGIPILHYAIATLACMIPGAAAYAWLGYAGRTALEGDGAALRHGLIGLAALAIVVLGPSLVRRLRNPPGAFMSVRELERSLRAERGPLIIDVRDPDEFAGALGHIPGALNIPIDRLLSRLDQVKAAHGRQIVLVCKTDKRSARAAATLREAGVSSATVLQGGMAAWNMHAPG
jgi:uncharacterized membrane protein YdjX (TVP38/TMEM64 family)/rhodanese-related sulfurtransferase